MVHMDVTMDDGGVDVDVYGVGYTSAQVKSAIAGATITPAQVGTASDPVGETHVSTANHDTTNTGELSVSDSAAVTGGPVGSEGEWIPLETFSYGGATSFSTTSTTYERVTTYQDYPTIDYGQISLTNINQLGLSLVGSTAQRGGTSDPVYVRLWDGTVGISGSGPLSSGIAPTARSDIDFDHLEMKVDGGEGEAFGLSLVLWGQIA